MAEGILKFVVIAAEVVVLFNLLILVHEFGHFLAARWRGLVVEKFAVWFGRPIWSRTIGGVEYRLGCIPAGGFVAIPQLAPMEALEGETKTPRADLPPAKPLDKIIVAAAGPVFSIGLAFAMAVLVWWAGKPEIEFDAPRIGTVVAGSPAEAAGLRPGDLILEVDGRPVRKFHSGTESVKWRIVRSEGSTIPFLVSRDGREVLIETGWEKPETAGWKRPALRQVGIAPLFSPGVGWVVPGSAAARAGLEPGDLVTSVDGVPIRDLDDLGKALRAHAGSEAVLGIQRMDTSRETRISVPGDAGAGAPLDLGVEWGRVSFTHPAPWTQVKDAATSIFRMIEALVSPRSDLKAAHFSGPIGIMRLYYQVFASDYGWQLALSLSVLINVNLGLLNLLPFPVLDGGHILLALIEAVRRKPLNVRVLEVLQTGCALLLIAFMLYVTFFDVGDFFSAKPPPEPTPGQPASP